MEELGGKTDIVEMDFIKVETVIPKLYDWKL